MKTLSLITVGIGLSLLVSPISEAGLHRLLEDDSKKPSRAPASVPKSQDELIGNLNSVEPEEDPEDREYEDRGPASAQPKTVQAKKAAARKSRLPASIVDGFELRVKSGKVTSTFWLVKRQDRFDLLFANSLGSRTSRGISSDSFNYLQSTAQEIPYFNENIVSCKGESIQLFVRSGGEERVVTSCIHSRHQTAGNVRDLGNLLSTMIR